MTGPVADGPVAEGDPAPPGARQIGGTVGALLCRAEPKVPIECGGDFGIARRTPPPTAAVEGRASGMDRLHVADGPVPDPLAEDADRVERVPLVAELRDDVVLLGGLHQLADLVDRVGQGLFAVDVLAALDGGHRRHCVGMVGRADDDRVDLLVDLVEHLAEIAVLPGLGPLFEGGGGMAAAIDVAQRDDVLAGEVVQIRSALPADADAGDTDLLAGRGLAALRNHMAGHDHHGCRAGRRSYELSTRNHWFLLHRSLPFSRQGLSSC